jgi:hypothetical protein
MGPAAADASGADDEPFPGREAGHLMRLRYTPWQHRVRAVEEEVSRHRAALESFRGLDGMPVVSAELHSMAASAAVAARATAPGARIAWIHTDAAALPLAHSRVLARLREEGVVDVTVTAGQAFGGDLEAVNVHSALAAARVAARASLAIVTQGPGSTGTGTDLGFSGLGLVEALHAAAALGGRPILAARMSEADPRPRHRGLSRHTLTALRCLLAPVALAVPPPSGPWRGSSEAAELAPAGFRVETIDAADVWEALHAHADALRTMGRGIDEDRLFFAAAAAAGILAARWSLSGEG